MNVRVFSAFPSCLPPRRSWPRTPRSPNSSSISCPTKPGGRGAVTWEDERISVFHALALSGFDSAGVIVPWCGWCTL